MANFGSTFTLGLRHLDLSWCGVYMGREWLVSLVVVRPGPIDAMHPEAGRKLIERLYADPSVDVGSKLYLEDIQYQAGVLQ